ncbi:uncharacterized protein LOC112971630 isoform X4 [Apteryx rowi]|uniref:uncharacterized protein LOC112971630 isoform X4 n=1 Tax=Apteryx rowi TaxID=308060 RepID=UPI000E1D3EC5|nr:uncharacterized protein LOC112971630 isoform X4 [Apteryx rowi]
MGGCKAGFRNEGRTCLIQPPTYLLPPLYSIWNFRAGICKLLFLFTESSESQRLKLPVGLCQEARCEVPSAVWAGFVFTLVDFHVWELHTSTLTQQRFLVRRNGIPRSCQNWTEIAALLCNKGKRIQQATPEICVQLFLCLYCNNPKSPMTSCVSLREQLSPFSPKRKRGRWKILDAAATEADPPLSRHMAN